MFNVRFKPRSQPGGNPPPAPASDPTELPRDLMLALENASVFMRASSAEGQPRAVIQLDGHGGWVHAPDETKAQLLKRWKLTDAQAERAVRFAGNLVRRAHRDTTQHRESWVRNW